MLSNEEYIVEGGLICPVCKSSNIFAGQLTRGSNTVFQDCTCGECGASWASEFLLSGYDELHTEEDGNDDRV